MTSASEAAYLTIRDMIACGDLRAGEPLIAEDLARYCGISRTPVREAILRLQAEMFAIRLDNKRTVVRSWSTDEIEDFIELRARLGGYTAARAAVRITDDQLSRLKNANSRLMALLRDGYQADQFQETSAEFYTLLVDIANSERLKQITSHVLNPGPLLRSLGQFSGQTDADRAGDHHDVILALEARDPNWAEAAMSVHVRKSYRRSMAPAAAAATLAAARKPAA